MQLSHLTSPTFGPGGNGEWFKSEGGKSTVQAPGWLEKKGLDAYEYEAGKGIIAVGIGIILMGIVGCTPLMDYGWVPFILGLAAGLVLLIRAGRKYNR